MEKRSIKYTPELWGGIECSFTRVKNHFIDQLLYSGHYERSVEDIERIAALGVQAIRYPLLWEHYKPQSFLDIDWLAMERPLQAMQRFQITPVIGLVHHGDGPAYTNLIRSSFSTELATYASQVAERFPWIDYYTPVNEPLTTARFSGLYGIWHPHRTSGKSFALILLNQMKAIVLAMQAIRRINPAAKLVQTEDLSKTYGTPLLKYQADFENERRWLTYDILCGDLKPGHALWDYFMWLKVPAPFLYFFVDNPCPPDIIGADHYLTSERYLDESIDRYPAYLHGGNGKHIYADAEAVRVQHRNPCGLRVLLKECWDRYRIPIAVTEVHLNSSADDQIRWFKEVYEICINLNQDGVNIPAITAWSLLGSFGWNKLLTEPYGDYEPGAFDLRSGIPEPTAFAEFLQDFSKDPHVRHPALNEKGWWHESNRFIYNAPVPDVAVDQIIH